MRGLGIKKGFEILTWALYYLSRYTDRLKSTL